MTLDIELINSNAPYQVKQSAKEGFVVFSTDDDVTLTIGFCPSDLITSDEAYEFMILNAEHKPSPRDPKVKETIVAIIDAFFSSNNNTILYICETGDGKQALRNRLFQDWFSGYSHKVNYVFLSTAINDEENVRNFATIIARNDNPNLQAVIEEFYATVKLFSEK